MKSRIKAGTTNLTLAILVYKTSDGTFFAGLTHASSGLVFEYRRRNQSTWTDVTAVAGTLGSFTSGGFVADGAQGGAYEVGIPNAAIAAGADLAYVRLRGVADMHPVIIEIALDVVDYQVAAFGANTTTPPTAAANATQVRTELATELARIDAAISSRSTYAGGAVASVTGAVTVGTNNDKSGYGLSGSERATLAALIDATLLDAGDATDLIASIVTRIGNTNVDQTAFVAAVKAALFDAGSAANKLSVNASGEVVASNYTAPENAATIADAVWDEILSGHTTVGSTGAALAAAGGSGDPWATALPGAYGTGTAGSILGNNLDATVSSRSTLTAANVWSHATRSLTTFGTLVSDIWSNATRTLTAISDSAGVTTLLSRITGTVRTASDDVTAETAQTAAVRSGLALEATLTSIKGATFDTSTDSLEAIRNRGDEAWVTGSGGGGGGSSLTGPWTRTITVTDSVSGDPIEGASVKLSLASDRETKLTNASGVVSFTVGNGTWTYEIFRSGYGGVTGTIVVSASGNTAVTLVANSPAPPVNPNNATLRVTCIGEDSQIAPGAIVSIRMIEAPAGQVGFGYDGTIATFTANSSGIAEREVARGATYEIRREGTYKQWQKFVMSTDQDLILITSFVQP